MPPATRLGPSQSFEPDELAEFIQYSVSINCSFLVFPTMANVYDRTRQGHSCLNGTTPIEAPQLKHKYTALNRFNRQDTTYSSTTTDISCFSTVPHGESRDLLPPRTWLDHTKPPMPVILHQTIHRLRTRNTTPRASRASFAADSLASTEHPALTMSQASSCFHSLASRQDRLQNRLPRLRHWEAMAAA